MSCKCSVLHIHQFGHSWWFSLQGHRCSSLWTLAMPEDDLLGLLSAWRGKTGLQGIFEKQESWTFYNTGCFTWKWWDLYPVNPLPICAFLPNNLILVSLFLVSQGDSSIPSNCSCRQKCEPIAGCRKCGLFWHELFLVQLSHGWSQPTFIWVCELIFC